MNNSGLITIESQIYLVSKLQTKRILNLATKQIKVEEMETYQFDKTTNVERKANETFLPNWSVELPVHLCELYIYTNTYRVQR